MSAARLPLQYRDSCAHLLIPLNRCRQQEYYLPWKCEVWLRMLKCSILPIVPGPVTDVKLCYRTRDTATRSANTRSSRSALRRWMNSGLLRTVRGAIDTNDTPVSTNVFELYETASYVNRDSDIVYPWTYIDVRC